MRGGGCGADRQERLQAILVELNGAVRECVTEETQAVLSSQVPPPLPTQALDFSYRLGLMLHSATERALRWVVVVF